MTMKLRILLCVLLLALAVVAGVSAEAFNPTPEGADTSAHAHVAPAAQGMIPPAVIDPNFIPWMPPVPVPTVPAPNLPDVAMTDGYTIYYNPYLASQLPPRVAAFVLAHEYGHIYNRTSNEVSADEFAAQVYRQTDPRVCYAAAWWMANTNNHGDATHPPGPVRAQIIAQTCGV